MPLPDPAPHSRTPAPLPLRDLVQAADARLALQPGGALLRVTGDPPEVHGLALAADHPLEVLLGLTAPPDWVAIGLHTKGCAFDLHDPGEGAAGLASGLAADPITAVDAHDAVPVTVTLLIDRDGRGAGILREGAVVRRLAGLPEGVVGDACRRALRLPTAPPPETTVSLWLQVWLDRVVDAAAAGGVRRGRTWAAVARRHPNAVALRSGCDPHDAAAATLELAETWPWDRLRHDPDCVDTARPPLQQYVARWMDDGMFARWLLAELADLRVLVRSARAVLQPSAVEGLAATFALCGLPFPPSEPHEDDR